MLVLELIAGRPHFDVWLTAVMLERSEGKYWSGITLKDKNWDKAL